jgi:hypothetical protein
MFAVLALNTLCAAQRVPTIAPKETDKRGPSAPVKASEATALTKEGPIATTRLERGSPEMERAFADRKFLEACTTLVTDKEMFLIDSAQIARDKESFAITFKVVNEVTQEPGQYRQLVYAFDGKEALVYFSDENSGHIKVKTAAGSNIKIKLPPWPPKWTPPKWNPPDWWPGSGGVTGWGGDIDWGDWKEISVECHASLLCPTFPFAHMGIMRQQVRASKSNPVIQETRWILVHCGC